MSRITLDALNQLDEAGFTATLASIYEHSPWVAARAAPERPFASVARLHAALQAQLLAASRAEQLALIRAHPELRGKPAAPETLTESSRREQSAAGLNRCSPVQLQHLRELNHAYLQRHAFPFILAVRGLGVDAVIAALSIRLTNDSEQEFRNCLQQIGHIARFRLEELIGEFKEEPQP